jgi:hypothetical protein
MHNALVLTKICLYICFSMQGATIYCKVDKDLIQKYNNMVKEDRVYVMINFRVSHDDSRIKTSCHNFKLEFVEGTRIRPVDGSLVPVDAYVFNGPTEFLGLCRQDEIMIGELLIELNEFQLNKLLFVGYFFY